MNPEAASMLRFMPAGTADLGEATRDELREADLGCWSDDTRRTDDLRGGLALEEEDTELIECPELAGFDVVRPLEDEAPQTEGPVLELRFSGA